MWKGILIGLIAATLLGVGAFLFGLRMPVHPEGQKPGKFPETSMRARLVRRVGRAVATFSASHFRPQRRLSREGPIDADGA
jgi:hypothetical protein